ncbi:MAG: biopolymer transporter ExbD [Halobacteriovorax sp.]|nr:biopolymer transporter ExbD [Halobacteriovorax sp.]|tara:strand:+ start:48678 stop:49067 length:390 start_codon:yes stop_codon:yes gene_type:complete
MKRRSRELSAPDITPLIDVVFLLLIFFMVSTVFKKDEVALLLNLPKMAHGESKVQPKTKMTIELSIEELAVDGKKLAIEDAKGAFAAVKDKTMPIEVRIDKEVKYDRVVSLLDALKEYELTNLSLITDK